MARFFWMVFVPLAITALMPTGQVRARITVDRIVAVVNGEIITLSEVQEIGKLELRKIRERYQGEAAAEQQARLEREILEELVRQKLQVQRAQRLGIRVSDADVDKAVREVQARTGLSEEEFRKAIAMQDMAYEKYREQVRIRIIQERLVNSQVRSKVRVSAEDVRAYYEQHQEEFIKADEVRARVIFMSKNSERTPDDDMTFQAMQHLRRLLLEGEDFAGLAREFSQDERARAGGDLGFIGRGMLPSHIEEAVFTLRPGEVSDILLDESGYYIYKVVEQKGARLATFEEVADRIRRVLSRQQERRQYETWLQELRREAIIENRYPVED